MRNARNLFRDLIGTSDVVVPMMGYGMVIVLTTSCLRDEVEKKGEGEIKSKIYTARVASANLQFQGPARSG